MENTWPQQLPHNRSSWLLYWANDLEKAILKNKNSDIPSFLPAVRVSGSRGFGANGQVFPVCVWGVVLILFPELKHST